MSGKTDKTVDWMFQDLVTLPELKAGKYTVEASVVMKDGKTQQEA